MRIACLHTIGSNVPVFETACRDLGNADVALIHEVRADLLAAAERAGGLTGELSDLTAEALVALSRDADAVLLTCSTLGPSVTGIEAIASVPVLRVDAALAHQAVRGGGKVIVLCAAETTLGPTRDLFEQAARATGAHVETRLVDGAWAAFKAGEQARYFDIIAAAADRAAGEGVCVALAQASMAGAVAQAREPKPLTSPSAGLAAAVAAATARSPQSA